MVAAAATKSSNAATVAQLNVSASPGKNTQPWRRLPQHPGTVVSTGLKQPQAASHPFCNSYSLCLSLRSISVRARSRCTIVDNCISRACWASCLRIASLSPDSYSNLHALFAAAADLPCNFRVDSRRLASSCRKVCIAFSYKLLQAEVTSRSTWAAKRRFGGAPTT